MTNSYLLDHLRPDTLVRIIDELIQDHADEMDTGEFNFQTEAAKAAYTELLDAGYRLLGEDNFNNLLEATLG